MCLLLGALAVSAASMAVAQAATPAVTVSLAPNDLTLRPGTSGPASLLLRNDADAAAVGLKLDAVMPAGVHVDGLPTTTFDLAPHTSDSRTVTVRVDRGSLSGALAVRATYAVSGSTEIVTGSLTVHPDTSLAVDSVVSTEVRSNLPTLDDHTTGGMVLLIHNKSSVPLNLSLPVAVRTTAKELVVTLQNTTSSASSLTLQPFDTAVFRYDATVQGAVKPGKQMVSFDATVTSDQLFPVPGVHVLATQPVDVQVFGEAALLGAISVPSILLLPGFLFVAVLVYLAKFIPGESSKVLPDVATPTFWVIAVTMSLLAVQISALVTGHFYFERYTFSDIGVLWLGGLITGGIVAGVWALFVHLWQRDRVPTPGDAPLTLLRKIQRTGDQIHLPYNSVPTLAGQRLAILDDGAGGTSSQRWVAPRIRVRVPANTSRRLIEAVDRRSAQAVADVIEREGLSAEWALDGAWPQAVDKTAITTDPANQDLIDVVVS